MCDFYSCTVSQHRLMPDPSEIRFPYSRGYAWNLPCLAKRCIFHDGINNCCSCPSIVKINEIGHCQTYTKKSTKKGPHNVYG